jgi:hypothetical protein
MKIYFLIATLMLTFGSLHAQYHHTCTSGCEIAFQDGSKRFNYYRKCDHCGYTESNIKRPGDTSTGLLAGSYLCIKCRKSSPVRIKTSTKPK